MKKQSSTVVLSPKLILLIFNSCAHLGNPENILDGPYKRETFEHKLSAYAGHRNHKRFYIGIACYDGSQSAKDAVENRGIGNSHHVDEDRDAMPDEIFFTYRMSKENGCSFEKELIKKHIQNRRCLNKRLGYDECSPCDHVVVYCRIYS